MSESLATLTWGQIGRLLSALFLGMFSLEVESYLATASTAQKLTYIFMKDLFIYYVYLRLDFQN